MNDKSQGPQSRIETDNIGSHGHSSILSESNDDPKTGGQITKFPSGATGSDVQHTAHSSTKARGSTQLKGKQLKHVDGSVNRKKSRSRKKDSQSHTVVCDEPNNRSNSINDNVLLDMGDILTSVNKVLCIAYHNKWYSQMRMCFIYLMLSNLNKIMK